MDNMSDQLNHLEISQLDPEQRRGSTTPLVLEEPCKQYCCSTFNTFADTKLTKLPDLQNPVNPIFRRTNFADIVPYDVIEMPLRLASRLIESDALVPFWNVLAYGDIRKPDGSKTTWAELDRAFAAYKWEETRYRLEAKPGQEVLNEANRGRAKMLLKRMADVVEFDLDSDVCDCGCSKEVEDGASTAPLEGPLEHHAAQFFTRGCKSRVYFGPGRIKRLTYMTQMSQRSSATPSARPVRREDYILEQYNFAWAMVHELAHAVNQAVHGQTLHEPLFKTGDGIAELGVEIEKAMFGGRVVDNVNNIPGLNFRRDHACAAARSKPFVRYAMLIELPSRSTNRRYRSGQPHLQRGKDRPYDYMWRVPLEWHESLLTESFWQTRAHGRDALRPRRMAGWAFASGRGGLVLRPVSSGTSKKCAVAPIVSQE